MMWCEVSCLRPAVAVTVALSLRRATSSDSNRRREQQFPLIYVATNAGEDDTMARSSFTLNRKNGDQLSGLLETPETTPRGWAIFAHCFTCGKNSRTAFHMSRARGTLTEPGRNSPFRDRSVPENLDLFMRMRAGEFSDGARTLRAKIDMASGNINLRDPAIYRIKHVEHQNTGNAWPIYPMYDFAHCLSDALEGITHSLCTLEFEDHRPLYDWFVENVDLVRHPELYQSVLDAGLAAPVAKPRQIESSRLNISYTVTSKRKLLTLVREGLVSGWDDPRMPTLQGLRRRGCPPAALHLFADRVGISKQNSLIDFSVLEACIRDSMDSTCAIKFTVLDPLKLIITNLDECHESLVTFPNHPKDRAFGERPVLFTPEIWIEKEDFAEVPAPGFHRLTQNSEVRLRGSDLSNATTLRQ